MSAYRLKIPVQVYWSDEEGKFVLAEGTINRPIWCVDVEIPDRVVEAEEGHRVRCGRPPLPKPEER